MPAPTRGWRWRNLLRGSSGRRIDGGSMDPHWSNDCDNNVCEVCGNISYKRSSDLRKYWLQTSSALLRLQVTMSFCLYECSFEEQRTYLVPIYV
ncbi:hypothetical protein PVAP13_8NG002302 [Panicum virgatum]|uniref:Uncharacterized protein n=1 Tax=Panicum virgatum TaxID=38727 RepID=A0A8T0PAD7_PANVG|nr:hypothetical protein PVAP13_8NG002302 [Panicum virgatum]